VKKILYALLIFLNINCGMDNECEKHSDCNSGELCIAKHADCWFGCNYCKKMNSKNCINNDDCVTCNKDGNNWKCLNDICVLENISSLELDGYTYTCSE
jgi:hypothetical protein